MPAKVSAISSAASLGDQPPAALPAIKGFIETSFLDWRSKIASVVFLPGCNFRCPFCHNHQLVSDPDQFQTIPIEGVLDRLEVFTGWIDGVVVTGGEPTAHPGLPALLGQIKDAGFAVKLDTNGYRPWVIEELVAANLVDLVAMDLKAPLESAAYSRAAGRELDLSRLRRSIDFLKSSGVEHEFRSTIIPTWHDEPALNAMGQTLRGCRRWTLQAMDPTNAWDQEAMADLTPYPSEEIERLQANLADAVCAVQAAD